MNHFSAFSSWARLAVAAGIALTACTAKEDVGPDEPCATTATVRFCFGNTTMCPTEHTTLELADGTRIRPTGKMWQAYLPQQVDGQVLRVSYQVVPRPTSSESGVTYAALSCLENRLPRCGNE